MLNAKRAPEAVARSCFDTMVGSRPRVVRVLGGVARGARLELDLTREKAYWLGRYERDVQDALRRFVTPGATVYDIGAHIGFFSVVAARLGATVYAFEAVSENAARARRNAELNAASFEVVEAAVWDDQEGVTLLRGDSDREWRTTAGGVVTTVTVDEFARGHEPPALLKIDVEGAEGHVLRGARNVLATVSPVVLCELHGEAARREALDMLTSSYEVSPFPGEWRVLAVPRRRSGDSGW